MSVQPSETAWVSAALAASGCGVQGPLSATPRCPLESRCGCVHCPHLPPRPDLVALALLPLQTRSARAASCPCPRRPLPSPCRRCRSQKVSPPLARVSGQPAPCSSVLCWLVSGGRACRAAASVNAVDAGAACCPRWQPHPPPHPQCPCCPAAQTAPAPASLAGVLPDAPFRSAGSAWVHQGETSSSEEAAPADGADADMKTPLLGQP